MLGRPFRFVHASDFHLDQPLFGLAEVPDHLIEPLANAPYKAATRVFDLALSEEVDFLLLAGGLVDPHRAGPRGLKFLSEQFTRLAEREIAVYWITSRSDGCERWPSNLHWPLNVHVLHGQRVERAIHARRGEPLCRITGVGVDTESPITGESIAQTLPGELAAGYGELFSIAVASHKLDPSTLAGLPVSYWAFGGEPKSATLLDLADPLRIARLSGSPQGRSPDETGPHTCTIVRVDETGRFRIEAQPTDVIRWHYERITTSASMTVSELDHLLHERVTEIIAATPDRIPLIRWMILGDGPFLATARRTGLAAELTSRLRSKYGFDTPAVAWTVAVDIQLPALPEAWCEQETLLGDFLRSVRDLEHSDVPLDLKTYISEQQSSGPFANYAAVVEPAARHSVLRQAGWLGADLLRSDDAGEKEAAR